MPNYMLLFYAADAERNDRAAREAEFPEWKRLQDEWAASGTLLASGRLHMPETATTVRVSDGDVELTDGPFAVTKEILGGYFLVDVPDLDEAVKLAAQIPVARYGKVEVRPEMTAEEAMRRADQAAAAE